MLRPLPYGCQQIDDVDVDAVVAALRGPYLTGGPTIERFEGALGEYLGAHASVCSNGTAALHLAYAALGLGDGDEIVTSPITFSATAAAAHLVGATVRFADVEPDTGNLDVAAVAAAIGPRTRAIVAVHLGGLPCDLPALRALADRHRLLLIEDAAHALGAELDGARLPRLSDAATFSFHPVKHITTTEGGAVVVRDPALKRRVDRLRSHGIERDPARFERLPAEPWVYEVHEAGWNYRLPDLACALGLAQLDRQPAWLERRRAIAARYRARFAASGGGPASTPKGAGHPGASTAPGRAVPQAERPGRASAYHLFPVLVDWAAAGTTRGAVMRRLAAAGVGSQVHYIPLTEQPLYRRRYGEPAPLPGAAAYYARTLSLPMFPGLTDAEVDRVVDAFEAALRPAPEVEP